MMFCRLNWSSQAIVMLPPMPSLWPAVWSVRFPPPKKNQIGTMVSPHLDAGDRVRPRLPGTLERRDRVAHRLHRGFERLRVRRLPDRREDGRGPVEGVEHRVVVFVELVELRLLDLDRRAESRVAAFRMADLRLSPSIVKIAFPIDCRPWTLPSIAIWSRMSSRSPRTPFSWFASWIRRRLSAARMSSRRR